MPSFTLGTASQATGTAKSTILRAIRAGRISAARSETGEYQIDPAELARVFPLLAIPGAPVTTTSATPESPSAERGATSIERGATTDMLVAELRATLSDMRQDRDRWRTAYEKEQAAHARTQEALATTQRLLPAPSATAPERGAPAVEQGAPPAGEGIERDATAGKDPDPVTESRGARLREFWFESNPPWRWSWRRRAA